MVSLVWPTYNLKMWGLQDPRRLRDTILGDWEGHPPLDPEGMSGPQFYLERQR